MSLDELKRKFILDEVGLRENLEEVVDIALRYCCVDKSGTVLLKTHDSPGKVRVRLALSAKSIANQLDESFDASMTVANLAKATGLAENQARARAAEAVDEGFAESSARGAYRANPYRVVQFLKSLTEGVAK